MNIYQYLKRDHAQQRNLANAIISKGTGSKRGYTLFMKFKRAWRRHTDIEARTLYSTLLRCPREHMITRYGIEGKRRVAECFNELERHPIGGDAWMIGFAELRERLEEQQCEEQELLYPAAERLITNPEIVQQMTEVYERHERDKLRPETPVTRLCFGKPRLLRRIESDWQEPVAVD